MGYRYAVHVFVMSMISVHPDSIKARAAAQAATVAQGSDVVLAESLQSLTKRDQLETIGRSTL